MSEVEKKKKRGKLHRYDTPPRRGFDLKWRLVGYQILHIFSSPLLELKRTRKGNLVQRHTAVNRELKQQRF